MTLRQVSKQFIEIISGQTMLLICHIPESKQGGRLITSCQLTWGFWGRRGESFLKLILWPNENHTV